jgi:hypothetical protein
MSQLMFQSPVVGTHEAVFGTATKLSSKPIDARLHHRASRAKTPR